MSLFIECELHVKLALWRRKKFTRHSMFVHGPISKFFLRTKRFYLVLPTIKVAGLLGCCAFTVKLLRDEVIMMMRFIINESR